VALKIANDKVTELWPPSTVMAAHHSDPHYDEGYLYGYSGDSTRGWRELKCVEFATGREAWAAGREADCGTLVAVDGYLLCFGNRGALCLVERRPDRFAKTAEFTVIEGRRPKDCFTGPVIARGKLYLRHRDRLLCYELTASAEPDGPMAASGTTH
jgi:hypothetical protein